MVLGKNLCPGRLTSYERYQLIIVEVYVLNIILWVYLESRDDEQGIHRAVRYFGAESILLV